MSESNLPTETVDFVARADSPGVEDRDSEKSGRKHGRGFIYMNLEDAELAIRKIDAHEKRMSKKSFAQANGHGDAVGRFNQKLAALESYGLVRSEGDNVFLTELAIEIAYGPTEQARVRARAKAFLSYDLFKETYVQCPKNQDHKMSFVDDYVRVNLKIVNERDVFLKRLLESAAYAGLLEGEPNPKAETIRLRPAIATSTNGDPSSAAKGKSPGEQWINVAPNEISALLEGMGLIAYLDRSDVSQRSAGEIAINMADGKITVEVRRPLRVVIRATNMLEDVTEVLKALQSKGFKA